MTRYTLVNLAGAQAIITPLQSFYMQPGWHPITALTTGESGALHEQSHAQLDFSKIGFLTLKKKKAIIHNEVWNIIYTRISLNTHPTLQTRDFKLRISPPFKTTWPRSWPHFFTGHATLLKKVLALRVCGRKKELKAWISLTMSGDHLRFYPNSRLHINPWPVVSHVAKLGPIKVFKASQGQRVFQESLELCKFLPGCSILPKQNCAHVFLFVVLVPLSWLASLSLESCIAGDVLRPTC